MDWDSWMPMSDPSNLLVKGPPSSKCRTVSPPDRVSPRGPLTEALTSYCSSPAASTLTRPPNSSPGDRVMMLMAPE